MLRCVLEIIGTLESSFVLSFPKGLSKSKYDDDLRQKTYKIIQALYKNFAKFGFCINEDY